VLKKTPDPQTRRNPSYSLLSLSEYTVLAAFHELISYERLVDFIEIILEVSHPSNTGCVSCTYSIKMLLLVALNIQFKFRWNN